MILSYISSLLLLVEGESCTRDTSSNCIDDTVSKLPGWGDEYTGNMYSGYIPIDETCHSAMFYWMLEKEGGSEPGVTPVLLWLNGGPGASSQDGLFEENIGPYQITENNTFTYNEYAWTNMYNVLIVDNPVGTGYSYTDNKRRCYCRNEEDVAEDFYILLNTFFTETHPEYATNPFYLVGESYAGKYIPNIAAYLITKDFPFVGVILGNGLYLAQSQYLSVPEIALNFGILDNNTYTVEVGKANKCVELIQKGRLHRAGVYCENFVDEIYSTLGGGVFRYDLRYYYDPTANLNLTGYLNRADVQSVLHTTGHTWTDSDETGPVADALRSDFTVSVMPKLETLLNAGKMVVLYNGQMDGSVCNNVGNSKIVDLLEWDGQAGFHNQPLTLWRLDAENVVGYHRLYENLAFVTIANAGHLVPMTQPKNYRIFLDKAVKCELATCSKK